MDAIAAPPDHDADLIPPRPLRHHLALTIYWLSNSLLWGCLLHTGLQSRLGDWFGEGTIGLYFGILGAVGGVVGTITQMVIGAFSDRSTHPWGRRRPFLVAGVLWGAGALVLLGRSHSFWPLAGALMLLQLGTNAALGPFSALLPDTVNPREHGKASGLLGVARLLGDVGGLILAAAFMGAEGLPPEQKALLHDARFPAMCNLMAGFMLLTMVISCITIREKRLLSRPGATVRQVLLGTFNVDVRGNPDFFWLSLSRAVTNIGFYMFLQVTILYLQFSLGMPNPEEANMKLMIPAIVAAGIGSVVSGALSDRYGRRPLIFASQYIMAGACVVFVFAPNITWAYVAGIPAGLAYGIFTAVEWALACNLLPKGEAARYLGVWNASAVVPQVLAFAIAPPLGSTISRLVPGLGWRVDFAVTVVLCIVGAYFLKHVHERRDVARGSTTDAQRLT
ncbi:MAG: MFS transporter [Armatimonadetes bacterium]|nr:MFS transporter [Armatimonadota bacterium]